MKLVTEFKQFAMRGNVVDMAVSIIIGGVFGKIVSSLIADGIMPPIGLLVGGINFSDIKIKLNNVVANLAGNANAQSVTIKPWKFHSNSVQFSNCGICYFYDNKSIEPDEEKRNRYSGSTLCTAATCQ